MSVDTVNYAVTNVRLRILKDPTSYSLDGARKLLSILDVMRMYLMAEDVQGFDRYINEVLGREPDAADFLLEELFNELGLGPNGIREDLDKILLAA
jgi:hypothetical protein